jgi:hypothetical protein
MPFSIKVSVICFLGFRWSFVVFVVLKHVRMFVCLDSLVMILVSFPTYVKVAYFCSFWWCFVPCGSVYVFFGIRA